MEVNKLPQETSNTFAYLQWIGNVHWEFLDTKIQSPSEPYGASDELLDSTSLFSQFIPGILFQQIWKKDPLLGDTTHYFCDEFVASPNSQQKGAAAQPSVPMHAHSEEIVSVGVQLSLPSNRGK